MSIRQQANRGAEAHEADVSRRSRSQATSLLIRAVTLCTASYSVKYIEDPMFRIILSGTISAACVPLIRSAWATFQSLKRQLQISGSQAHDVPDQSQGDEEFARSLRAKTIEAVEQAKHHLSISQESPEDGSKTVLTVPEDYVKSIEALATDLRDYLSREVACVSQSSAE